MSKKPSPALQTDQFLSRIIMSVVIVVVAGAAIYIISNNSSEPAASKPTSVVQGSAKYDEEMLASEQADRDSNTQASLTHATAAASLAQAPSQKAAAYHRQGQAHYRLGNYLAAESSERQALVNQTTTPALYSLGLCLAAQTKYQEAVDAYTQAIQFSANYAPGYSAPYASRAIAYQHMGQHDKALADINQALKLEPNNKAYQATKASFIAKN